MDDFTGVIPYGIVYEVLGKQEMARFNKWMSGQTVMVLERQAGIYYSDLSRYLSGRKKGLKAKDVDVLD